MRKFEICKGYENKATLPKRGTKYSAGYDFYTTNDVAVTIYPNETIKFHTGIKAYMNSDEVLLLHVRSSVGIKRNLVFANATGVIDSDYVDNPSNEGEIILALHNIGKYPQTIYPRERIAQGIFMKYLTTDDDGADGERKGGIGSTN